MSIPLKTEARRATFVEHLPHKPNVAGRFGEVAFTNSRAGGSA